MKNVVLILTAALLLFSCGEKTPREKALEDAEVQTFKGAKIKCQILGGNEFDAGKMVNFDVNDSVVIVSLIYKYKNDFGVIKNDNSFDFYILKDGYSSNITHIIELYASKEELDKCLLRIKYASKQ